MNLTYILQLLVTRGLTVREARNLEPVIRRQLKDTGKFEIEALGGWVFGKLTNHGVVIGV